MKNTNTKPVVPVAPDGMPPEVATALLIAPKAKLTARMRKTCRAARERVYPSVAPIRKIPGTDPAQYEYQLDAKIDTGVKLERLARGLKWDQLLSHLKRWTKRRAKLQTEYLRLMESPTESPEFKESRGRVLTWAAGQIELGQDALTAEIERRQKITQLTKS